MKAISSLGVRSPCFPSSASIKKLHQICFFQKWVKCKSWIKYLDKKPGKKELASKIIKEISPADDRFSRVSFYKLFEQEEYFIKDDTDKLMISLYKNKNLVL